MVAGVTLGALPQARLTAPSPPVAVNPTGASGMVCVATALEASLPPASLTARTLNVYAVPLVKPVMTA